MLKKILYKDFYFLLFFVIALIVFIPSLQNLNFFWDDERFVFANPTVLKAPYWYSFWIKNSDFYKTWPVSYSLFWLLLKLKFMPNLIFLKGLNIFFHSCNAYLLYKFLAKIQISYPFFCSLFFLVHPLSVETVSWIFQLSGILALFFFLSSLTLFVDYLHGKSWGNFFFSLLFFQLSLWSKSVSMTFCFLYLLLIFLTKKKYWLVIPFIIISLNSSLANRFGTDYFVQNSQQTNLSIVSKKSILRKYDEVTSFKSGS